MSLPRPRPLALALAGLTAASLTSVVTGSPAAHAEVVGVSDPAGDARRFGDLSRVTVRHERRWVGVRMDFAPGATFPDYPTVWIDTDASSPGPEFYALGDTDAFGEDATRFEVRSVDGAFRLQPATTACVRMTMKVESDGGASVRMPVPRRCLGNPDRVRVSVQTWQGTGGRDD